MFLFLLFFHFCCCGVFFLTDFWFFSGFPLVRTFLDITLLKNLPWACSMVHFEGMMLCYNINAVLGFELTCKYHFLTVELQKCANFKKNAKKSCDGFFSDISYSERGKMPRVGLFGFFVPYMSLVLENTLNTPCLYLITSLNWASLHQLEKNHATKMVILTHFWVKSAKYSKLRIR